MKAKVKTKKKKQVVLTLSETEAEELMQVLYEEVTWRDHEDKYGNDTPERVHSILYKALED